MPNFLSYEHPVLAVTCPSCPAGIADRCFNEHSIPIRGFHAERLFKYQNLVAVQYGEGARIDLKEGKWVVTRSNPIHFREALPNDTFRTSA